MYLEFEKKLNLIKKLDKDNYSELKEEFGEKLDDYFKKYINKLDVNDIDSYNKIWYYIDIKSDFTEVSDINNNFNKSYIIYMNDVRRYPVLSERESVDRLSIICSLRDELNRLNVNDTVLNNILLKYNYDKKIKTDLLSRKIQLKFLKNNLDKISRDDFYIFDMYIKYIIEKEYFYNCNLRLVVYYAKMKAHNENDLLDSIQSGNIGLINAIERYDITSGTQFSTYASYWINSCMIRSYKRNASSIVVSYNTIDLVSGYKKFCDEFYKTNGTMPKEEDKLSYFIKRQNNEDDDYLQQIKKAKKNLKKAELAISRSTTVSLNSPCSMEDDESELIDFIVDDTVTMENMEYSEILKENLKKVFKYLNNKEICVLLLRHEIRIADYLSFDEVKLVFSTLTDEQVKMLMMNKYQLTLEQIGRILSITRERVRQIEKRSKNKIKKKGKRFKDYI